MRFLILYFTALAVLSGCNPKVGGGTSSVSLKVPTLSELQSLSGGSLSGSSAGPIAQSISASDRDWSKACFMVNVTGPDITDSTFRPACGITTGAFAGSVGPGGALTVSVPKGNDRKFEVFAFFRSSSALPCDAKKSVNEFDLGHTSRLGSAVASILKDDESVDISLSLSAAQQTVVAQYGLPGSCDASGPGPGPIRFVSGSAVKTTTLGYKATVRIGAPPLKVDTTSGGYKVLRRGQ